MRLERDDQAAAERRARGGQHRGNLGRVMAVVVDDEHAAGLAVALEAPLGAVELPQRRGDARELDADALGDGHRRQRVLQVVPARARASSSVAEPVACPPRRGGDRAARRRTRRARRRVPTMCASGLSRP